MLLGKTLTLLSLARKSNNLQSLSIFSWVSLFLVKEIKYIANGARGRVSAREAVEYMWMWSHQLDEISENDEDDDIESLAYFAPWLIGKMFPFLLRASWESRLFSTLFNGWDFRDFLTFFIFFFASSPFCRMTMYCWKRCEVKGDLSEKFGSERSSFHHN